MKLSKLYSNREEILPTVEFSPGLNLIVPKDTGGDRGGPMRSDAIQFVEPFPAGEERPLLALGKWWQKWFNVRFSGKNIFFGILRLVLSLKFII
ncbi:MAG: hypothetical protein LBF38_02545 [Deltaproteobacteria bacterium]|jgi:hypothetical protein|nr:hypothetical protein [Deltaproteobacteria bacterium]